MVNSRPWVGNHRPSTGNRSRGGSNIPLLSRASNEPLLKPMRGTVPLLKTPDGNVLLPKPSDGNRHKGRHRKSNDPVDDRGILPKPLGDTRRKGRLRDGIRHKGCTHNLMDGHLATDKVATQASALIPRDERVPTPGAGQ